MTPIDTPLVPHLQPKAWHLVSRSFRSGRLAGTYLLHGNDGVGRWAFAIEMAALVNCENPEEDTLDGREISRPCHACRSCRQVLSLNHEGLLIAAALPPRKKSDDAIDQLNEVLQDKRDEPFAVLKASGSRTIPIERAREIKRQLSSRASAGITRLVLFHQMEYMRQASADALLKMIEEPPSDTLMIMTTVQPEALLPTLSSRSRLIRLDRVRSDLIESYVTSHYEYATERVRLVARLADGSLGRALEMLVADDEGEQQRRLAAVAVFDSLVNQTGPQTVAMLHSEVDLKDRHEIVRLLQLWQSLIRDCSLLAQVPESQEVTNIDCHSILDQLAPRFQSAEVARTMVQQIKLTLADLGRNVHIPGAVTALALRLRRCFGPSSRHSMT